METVPVQVTEAGGESGQVTVSHKQEKCLQTKNMSKLLHPDALFNLFFYTNFLAKCDSKSVPKKTRLIKMLRNAPGEGRTFQILELLSNPDFFTLSESYSFPGGYFFGPEK